MAHYKYLHRTTFIRDALWLLGINFIFLIFFASYDIFELVMGFVSKHEHLELDELLPLSATLTISLLIFTYRRVKELGKITYAFEQLAKLDPLTKTLNRRSGQAALSSFCHKAQTNKQGFALLQLDLDNFKRINDLYGASVGDEILIKTALCIDESLPKNSALIRWHSDTFLILLPDNTHGAYPFANKLRQNISDSILALSEPITCSVGIALWKKGLSEADMLHNVEDALLDAKADGKNMAKVA